jgi:ribonuclease BN (tRNA processing enzyme)
MKTDADIYSIQTIKDLSQGNLVVTFAGVGSAFAKKNDQSSLIIAKNGKTILVDMGPTIPLTLSKHGIKTTDFDYYHITHSHADHVGGIEELLLMSRYVIKKKPNFILTFPYADTLWEKTLKGGCEINEDGRLVFSDLANIIYPRWTAECPREIYEITVDDIKLKIFRTIHIPGGVTEWGKAFWSTGLVIDERIFFSGDSRFDAPLFDQLKVDSCELAFHDVQLFNPGTVHAAYDELKMLPKSIKEKLFLYHYGDNYETFNPRNDGFAGFAEAWTPYVLPIHEEEIPF